MRARRPVAQLTAAWCLLVFFIVVSSLRAATAATLEARMLGVPPDVSIGAVTSGHFDSQSEPLTGPTVKGPHGIFWLQLSTVGNSPSGLIPVLVVHAARQCRLTLFAGRTAPIALPPVTSLAAFRGAQDRVYLLPAVSDAPLYLRVDANVGEPLIGVSLDTLREVIERGAEHARMVDLAVGALTAMSIAALLIWSVYMEKLFVLYGTLFFLQAVYIAFLSGQAFDWPLLSRASPLNSFTWNVPIGLSGAVACLFAREIADLKNFAPRSYRIFGYFAVAFGVVTLANLAKLFGYGAVINAIGNVFFLAVSVFTLVVAFLSWRRGNRAAGWFLLAWSVLEGFTMAAAVRFLITGSADSDTALFYYGLPLSMVAAAVLIALGVADRLRQQRAALEHAERRAQTDPLTGVLNRRSLVECLDAACVRARASALPVALLFIDLDHFKQINDSFGHQAGDACLRAIVGPMHAELRQSDVIGRYGGEEFVIILSSADAAAALPIAQRILARVAAIRVDGYGAPIAMTCSIGVAASDQLGVWGEQLIACADAAVYRAKRAGRNTVELASAGA